MAPLADERPITRIATFYLYPPFLKELDKRHRETRLIEALEECIAKLRTKPTQRGLNLEFIDRCGGHRVFSARIKDDDRLILAEVRSEEVGLLYFGGHDPAYRWVDQNRKSIPGMLQRAAELPPGHGLRAPLPFPRPDTDAPLAIPDASAIRTMLARGMAGYLAHLDGDQTYLARTQIAERKGLTLVKGGAGTGKTALAVTRVGYLAQFPEMGYGRALYLCYNQVLAETVAHILDTQFGGRYPREQIEVARVVQWSRRYLEQRHTPLSIRTEPEWLSNKVGRVLVRHPELREQTGGLSIRDIVNEIRYVLRPNGFTLLDEYLGVERRGMKVQLKRQQRAAIWSVYAMLPQVADGQVELDDLPALALASLEADEAFTPYRAVVVDEAQDFTPVMVRLAKALVRGDERRLFFLADVSQSIYPSGFYWAQRELKTRGGQVTYLRTTYRTTREVDALARALYDGATDEEIRRDIGEMYPPLRSGPLPVLAVHASPAEEAEWIAAAVRRDLDGADGEPAWRPEQIAVLAQTHAVLERIADALVRAGIPLPQRERDAFRVDVMQPSIKLATMYAVKGLDFPVVYLVGLATDVLFENDRSPNLRRHDTEQLPARAVHPGAFRPSTDHWSSRRPLSGGGRRR
jgi:superfamily I DNA/RNA helicase